MGLFKFQNYSAIKNAQDNPRVVAAEETKNGQVFGVGYNVTIDGNEVKEGQVPFADEDAAKGDVWVMMNIVDKPETRNYEDYKVEMGEFIRAFNLNNMVGELVELSSDLVKDDEGDVSKGDYLVPTNGTDDDGDEKIWKKIADPASYNVYLEVTDVTAFGLFTIDNSGVGFEAVVKYAGDEDAPTD